MENTKYPTHPSAEGFFYETEDDATQEILTKKYENGSIVKQIKLPKCGKLAVVRSLKAKETAEISRLMGQDKDKYMMATITVATSFDGIKLPIEDVAELPMKDYQLLMAMCGELNF